MHSLYCDFFNSHPGVNFNNALRTPFCTKVFCAAFLYLQFGFVTFCGKNISAKAVCKMLAKLTLGVNFTKVFCARFLCKCLFSSYVLAWTNLNVTRKKVFVRKTHAKNVGEIDNRWRYCALIVEKKTKLIKL
jgi:hypothetical protein